MNCKGYLVLLIAVSALCSCNSRRTISDQNCETSSRLNRRAREYLLTLPDSAFLLANTAVNLTKETCEKENADAHAIIGLIFYQHAFYQDALIHLQEAAARYETLKENKPLAEIFNQLGLVYYNIKQPGLSQEFHSKALTLYQKLKDENGIAYSYGCLGRLCEKRQEYQQALDFQRQALAKYENSKDKKGQALILENIGSIYEDQNNLSLALDYFTRSLKLTEQTGDSLQMIVDLNNIGDSYRKTGQYKTAVEWTQRAVNLASRLKDRYQLSSGYKDLSKIYGLSGEYALAYENLEKGRTLYQEIYTQDAARQLALFQILFEVERKNHSIQSLESDQKLSTFVKFALGISLGFLVMLATVVISRQRLKIQKNNEEINTNQQIYEAQRKLMEKEIENTHLHEQKLQNELETKVKSLTSHTLHIIGKNKTLEDIQTKLTVLIKEGPSDRRSEIKGIIKMIERNFVQDKDWADFRQIFEQVHQDFFIRLQKQSPDLTPSEIRLASLIRLAIPSKDIAVLLGISHDSLRIARYRLRKKLNLDQGASLTGYIGSI